MIDRFIAAGICGILPCMLVMVCPGCSRAPEAPAALQEQAPSPAQAAPSAPPQPDPYANYGGYGPLEVKFIDDVATNVSVGDEIASLSFTDINGAETKLSDYIGKKSVILVITRGNTSYICPYCTTQTSRLIANYQKFADRNAEVLVVYPIEHSSDKGKLDAFLQASKKLLDDPNQPVPFPVLLDVELKAVDQLGIRKDLSKPATYILNADGRVRFAYVGANIDDRPSIDAMIKQLDADASSTETAAQTP